MDQRDAPERAPVRAGHIAGLALLTLAALGLRLWGLDYALPHMIEPDAELASQVEHLREGTMNPRVRRDWPTYPLLVPYMVCLTPPPERPAADADVPLEQHLAAAGATLLDTRRTVALFSVLVVPAAFLLARRFLSPSWSLFAAALVALSTLGQSLAQQARPHAVLAVFVALGLVAALRLERGWLRYSVAAFLVFCAVGTLHSGIALLLPVFWAHLRLAGPRRVVAPQALLVLLAPFAAIPVFYPFLFNPKSTGVEEDMATFGTHEIMSHWFDGGGFRTVARTLWSYEPVLALLALLGFVVWVLRASRGVRPLWSPSALVLLAYAVPYLLVLGVFRNTVDRFVIPALPCFAVLGTWGLASVVRGRVAVALAALALAVPSFAAAKLALVRSRPDTLTEVTEWALEHVAPGETIYLAPRPSMPNQNSSIDLPLARDEWGILGPGGARTRDYNQWTRYQRFAEGLDGRFPRYDIQWHFLLERDLASRNPEHRRLERSLRDFFVSTGPGLFVIEDFRGRYHADMLGLRDALVEFGEPLLRISPDGDPEWTTFPLLYRDPNSSLADLPDRPREHWPHFTARLFQARAWGPVVEVYRVTAEALAK